VSHFGSVLVSKFGLVCEQRVETPVKQCTGSLLAGSALTVGDQMLAAIGASAAVSLVACPTELMKCRLQAQGCSRTARQRLIAAGVDPNKVGGGESLRV
jgi:hypothetical protein